MLVTTFACLLLSSIVYSIWRIVLAPHFSPLRGLPVPPQKPWYKRFLVEPDAGDQERWINEVPNNGLIRYFGAFNRESLLVTRPDTIKEFLQVNGYKFHKFEAGTNVMEQIIGHGLLVVNGEEHKLQRKALNPAFKFKFIKESYPVFWKHTAGFVHTIEEKIDQSNGAATIELDDWLQRVTFDIISDTGFGLHLNAVNNPTGDIVTTFALGNSASPRAHKHRMLSFILPQWAFWRFPGARKREIDHIVKLIREVSLPLIKDRRQAYAGKELSKAEMEDDTTENEKAAHSDILATLLRSPHAASFTDEFLIAQAGTFMLAGQDTTSVATTWALHLLSKHPEIQNRLRDEIRKNLPSPDDEFAQINPHLLESLPLLHAVCNETLRLYSPAPQIRRTCKDPTATIQGYSVPVGTIVNASEWATQRSKHIWGNDVHEFKPERFLKTNDETGEIRFDGSGGLKGDAAVYGNLPFGAGTRSCIGERFARAEFAALLAGLVGRLEWLPSAETPDQVKVNWGIVTKPADRLKVVAKRVAGW